MPGECSLVNLTASSSITWIIDLVLQQQQGTATQQQHTYELNLKTKYYTAAVKLKHLAYSDTEPDQISDQFDETEALLIYCDGTKECLSRADRVWGWAKEHNPAICLFIIDSTKDRVDKEDGGEVTRTEIMSWCLANNFELVECDEVDDSDPDGVADIVGKDRILEALKSHTWSTMELIEPSQQKQEKTNQNFEESLDSFDALFAELASIKAKADSLPADERKAYAEKIALSFYAAMGASDEED